MAGLSRVSVIEALKSYFDGLQVWWHPMFDRWEFWIDYREIKLTEYMIHFEMTSFDDAFVMIRAMYKDIDFYLDAIWG